MCRHWFRRRHHCDTFRVRHCTRCCDTAWADDREAERLLSGYWMGEGKRWKIS